MHVVAVIATHGVLPFDLATPCETFAWITPAGADRYYDIRVCGEAREIRAGAYDLRVHHDLDAVAGADTVIVPGVADVAALPSRAVVDTLRRSAAAGSRIASICTGAFTLAAAGLLDGLRATTHWRAARELATRYPAVTVDPNVLFVDNGAILTSAGAAAGLDLCLHMIRRDYGAAVAAAAARGAVMPLEREGGQAQFIVHDLPPSLGVPHQALLEWIVANLHRPLCLDDIARQAGVSERTLARRFREQTGCSPLQWVLAARVRRAQELLETSALSVEQVAAQVGFESAATLRERFRLTLGTTPTGYRKAFTHAPPQPGTRSRPRTAAA